MSRRLCCNLSAYFSRVYFQKPDNNKKRMPAYQLL